MRHIRGSSIVSRVTPVRVAAGASTLLLVALVGTSGPAADAGNPAPVADQWIGTRDAVDEGGRVPDGQSEAFKRAKLELRVWKDADGVPRVHDHPADLASLPGSKLLASAAMWSDIPVDPGTSDERYVLGSADFAVNIVEPPSSGDDANGNHYYDGYYPNFCGPGAATVAIHEWRPNYVNGYPSANRNEPSYAAHRVTTYWANSTKSTHRLRSYLMYLAEDLMAGSYETPGMVSFSKPPDTSWDATTYTTELKDALNWEVTGGASYWQNYYYTYHSKSAIGSKGTLMAIVSNAIGMDDVAVIFNVHTDSALGWDRDIDHSVAILGYDNQAGDANDRYYYVDTCGHTCSWGNNPTDNTGRWVSAAAMWTGLEGAFY